MTEITGQAATEEWRPIPGHSGRYEVSNLGNVRCWKGSENARAKARRPYAKVLKTWIAKGNQRRHVSLGYNGSEGRKARIVSNLVAEAFIGPRPEGLDVCHNNGDSLDDRAVNLRYDTRAGNMADTVEHGTRRQGESSHFAKITEDDVREIRRRRAAGEAHKTIAADFGICEDNSSAICRRVSWKHVA